jgi:hypothetical protein
LTLFPSVSSLSRACVAVVLFLVAAVASHAQPVDPLPSWNAGTAKARIVAFVQSVTEPGGKDFVPPADRIAVFDNDGTLWSEQPMYFQLAFALDRVRALAPKRPEWKTKQPFKAAIEGDMKTLAAAGERGLLELVAASHAGMTTDEFAAVHRADLHAHGRNAGLPARQRLPDLDRLGRRHRVHARLCRAGLRRAAAADGRL